VPPGTNPLSPRTLERPSVARWFRWIELTTSRASGRVVVLNNEERWDAGRHESFTSYLLTVAVEAHPASVMSNQRHRPNHYSAALAALSHLHNDCELMSRHSKTNCRLRCDRHLTECGNVRSYVHRQTINKQASIPVPSVIFMKSSTSLKWDALLVSVLRNENLFIII